MLDCWLKIGFCNQLTEENLALWIDASSSFLNSVTVKPWIIAIQNKNYPSWHRCFPNWNSCSSSLHSVSMAKRNCRHGVFLPFFSHLHGAYYFLESTTDLTICTKGTSLALLLSQDLEQQHMRLCPACPKAGTARVLHFDWHLSSLSEQVNNPCVSGMLPLIHGISQQKTTLIQHAGI